MVFSTTLLAILSHLDQTFHPDELAYLAATSKVEGTIRDRVAFRLHAELPASLFVHREWRDPKKNGWMDIAITDEVNRPLYLIELKAHSGPTFQAGYSEKIRKDLQKLYQAAEPETELYFLFLFNHLFSQEKIDSKFQYVIKYYPLQNAASKLNEFAEDVSPQTKRHWEQHLKRIGLSSGSVNPGTRIAAGRFHGIPLSVHAYLLGPLYRADLEGLFT
jgi:hypothetical protein